jgi:hypothetical protein
MPKLNDRGEATTGYLRCWYDQQRSILQNCVPPPCRIELSDGIPIDANAASYVYANGRGTWVAFFAGSPALPSRGVWNQSFQLPLAGLTRAIEPVGPDDSIAYKVLFNSYGPWKSRHADGSEGPTFGGDCQFVQNLGNDCFIWTEGGRLRGLGVVVPDIECSWPIWRQGHLLYQALSGELVLDGHVIAPPSYSYFRPDFMVKPNGSYYIVWSPTEGEDSFVPLTLTQEQLDATPLISAIVIAPFTHPVLIAPFKDPAGTSGADAEIVVNHGAQWVVRPYIVAEDSLAGPFLGERLGIYSEAVDPFTVLGVAASLQTRLVLCHDASTPWTLPSGLRPWDIPAIEGYPSAGKTPLESVPDWFAAMRKLLTDWSGDCGYVPMFYLQQKTDPTDPRGWSERWTVAEVITGLAHLSEIVNLSRRIKLVMPFEWERLNGITGHTQLRAVFESLKLATPSQPTFIAVGMPPVPPSPPTPPPPPEPPPTPQPEDPDMLIPSDKFEEWITETGRIAEPFIRHDPRDPLSARVQAEQGAREISDKYRADNANPTIGEMVMGAIFRSGLPPQDDTKMIALVADIRATQERLRRL